MVTKKTISYYGCADQLGGFLVFIMGEIFMLAVMAYDHYVAICKPLLYLVLVYPQICLLLVSLQSDHHPDILFLCVLCVALLIQCDQAFLL